MAGLGGSLGYAMGGIDWGALGGFKQIFFGNNKTYVSTIVRNVVRRSRALRVHDSSVYFHFVRGDHHHFI